MYLVESVFHLKDVVPNEVLGHRPAVLISKMAHMGDQAIGSRSAAAVLRHDTSEGYTGGPDNCPVHKNIPTAHEVSTRRTRFGQFAAKTGQRCYRL